ncbi:DEAD domain-containing protein/Helicase_C domain-containing protein [Cephalotus follicularis]|uniref:DEAD domain-containing protein/Helicase_C domain-containing protein n=1 Tax=Cephalotus follicularis TaxID=3775 RepID=A0A1Q3BMP3_CEPFO|nr:DEAD domain-containing protein/Helicase_C domain-containing protein [Cephalotus follicularis]
MEVKAVHLPYPPWCIKSKDTRKQQKSLFLCHRRPNPQLITTLVTVRPAAAYTRPLQLDGDDDFVVLGATGTPTHDTHYAPPPPPPPPPPAPTPGLAAAAAATSFGRLKSHRVNTLIKRKQQLESANSNNVSRKTTAPHLSGWGNKPSLPHHSTTDAHFFSRKSFADLGCTQFMVDSLKHQLFLRPANIQAMAFPPVIEGKSCIIADQSGSGKTLAYLLPVIQRLRQEELQGLSISSSQSPRVVILLPTAELASQVFSNCRSMSKTGVPFRSMVVTGGFRQRTQLENLQLGVDVLIATPGRLMYLLKEGFLKLTNLRCAVLDEIDILYKDEDFEASLQSLINSSPVTAQYLFVTATLPVDIYNKLVEVFPDCKVIMGPGMHRISPGLEEVLVDCSGDVTVKTPDTAFINKKSALLQLVEKTPVPKTLIFCNKIETCRKVENVLKRFDRKGTRLQVFPFHAAVAQETRLENMKEFTKSRPEEESLFLVCTDRTSRGIDFAGVDHVVLFDFPRDPSEYVRRVGRTARGAGGKGKAFIFVVGKQVSLARKIMERNQKGHPLHDVPSAYELQG